MWLRDAHGKSDGKRYHVETQAELIAAQKGDEIQLGEFWKASRRRQYVTWVSGGRGDFSKGVAEAGGGAVKGVSKYTHAVISF